MLFLVLVRNLVSLIPVAASWRTGLRFVLVATAALASSCNTLLPAPPLEPIEPVYNTVDTELTAIDGLDEETLYRLLTAEIAGRQENHQLALDNYLWAANHTKELAIIARAMGVASFLGDQQAITELARLWLRQEPEANRPHLALAAVALGDNKIDNALHHLRSVMQKPGPAAAKLWLVMGTMEHLSKNIQIEVLSQLVGKLDDNLETNMAYARVLLQLEEVSRAKQVLANLTETNPKNEPGIILYVATLRNQGHEVQATSWLGQHLEENPNLLQVRSYYARLLVEMNRYREAGEQLQLLLQGDLDEDEQGEYLILLASVQTEIGHYEKARKNLEKVIWVESSQYTDQAAWRLGLLAESNEQNQLALKWYNSINEPQLAALAKVRSIPLKHRGDITATRAAFATLAEAQPQLLNEIIEVEATWLAKTNMYDDALMMYNDAIERDDNHFWRYSRAILAEEYGDLELFEKDMRHIISGDENHAEALNALGYTLAEKTDRLDEAYGLIYRAMLLRPNNFYILDSMGWVLYRLGYSQEALEFLDRAYKIRNDPEIASHIIHIMADTGKKDQARQLLRKNMRLFPDDKKLEAVRRQFSL